ncbi:GNAT domain-containing protein [Cladorrhinum sp. PSN332]|nr:GNAT domain-containing protein [Cladorrhinum sp. PSN332]
MSQPKYDPAPDPSTFIKVKTTLPRQPFPPNSERKPFHTERLTLRALAQEDLDSLHRLRTQPEVMQWTALKKCDKDLAETQTRLDPFLEPNDARTYNFAICLKGTGEFIGIGGFHNTGGSLFGWPEVGYMFVKECWGRGYATEFLKGFGELWRGLEREEVELEVGVDERTVVVREQAQGAVVVVEEVLIAVTAEGNGKSQSVLRKCGFEEFVKWKDEKEGGTGDVLPCFRLFPLRV